MPPPDTNTRVAQPETSSLRAIPAVILAWLVPGGGHFYLRRPGKAAVFLSAILALFVLGVAMDSRLQMTMGLDDLTVWVLFYGPEGGERPGAP